MATLPSSTTAAAPDLDAALKLALARLMAPLARLAVAQGLPFPATEELLKQAFVQAARDAQPESVGERDISRISTATGLSRREVTRLTQQASRAAVVRPSPALQLFTRWANDPALKNARGRPMALVRQGPAPSFEALAQAVTRDVHPRSLLDELVRLGLAEVDASGEQVRLLRSMFVPRGDAQRMLGFLGQNVADHLAAAADNVVHADERHFEQAMFCGELSAASLADVRALIETHWRALMADMVPRLNALIDADAAQPAGAQQRLRIGLYTYNEAAPRAPDPEE